MKIGYDFSSLLQQESGIDQLGELLRIIAENGYDFAELPVAWLADLSEEAFIDIKENAYKSGLPVLVGSGLLPNTTKLTGPEADLTQIVDYLNPAFQRFRVLGGTTIVLRDGQARSVPNGFAKEAGIAQLEQFLIWCDELGERLQLVVALEPLNRRETNLVKRLEDALELTARLYLPHLKLAVDPYHMHIEREELDTVEEAVDMELLEHVHVTIGEDGLPLADGTPYEAFFETAKRAGYNGTISICSALHDWNRLQSSSAAAIHYMSGVLGTDRRIR